MRLRKLTVISVITFAPTAYAQLSDDRAGKFRAYRIPHAGAAPQETHMHYIFNKGGVASNVVPAYAEALPKANAVPEGLGRQERVLPVSKEAGSASSDVGDVSWLIPTAQLSTATFVPGISSHSWASTACAGMSIGRKGMALPAKTPALSVVDLITEPSQLTEVKASFEEARAGKEYKSRIPAGSKPPLDYRSDISAQ